MIVVLDRI